MHQCILMTDMAEYQLEEKDGQPRLRVAGRLTLSGLGDFPQRLDALDGPVHAVDLSGVGRIDTVGAWVIRRFAEQHQAQIVNASADAARLMALVGSQQDDVGAPHRQETAQRLPLA